MKSLTGSESIFDSIRRFDEQGNEYWLARELMPVLEYRKWERFVDAIDRAKLSCFNSGASVDNHYVDAGIYTRGIPSDYKISRYACYLVAMCGDPRKAAVAQAQTYFAVKTYEAETSIPGKNAELEKLRLENENLKLQVKLSDNQQKLLATVHLLECVSPGLAPLALGKADAEVERIEYIDRTITEQGTYEGVGITYIQKKYGFKNTVKTWEWLESVGMGKSSGVWQLQLSAVESHKLPPYALAEIAKKFSNKEGDRQLLLGE